MLGSPTGRVTCGFAGAIAQLEEHLLCKQGVRGSSPLSSTVRYNQVSRRFASGLVDLHKAYYGWRARCVPDRLPVPLRPARLSCFLASWLSAARVLLWPIRAISSRRLASLARTRRLRRTGHKTMMRNHRQRYSPV
jgi:hypothetical protein